MKNALTLIRLRFLRMWPVILGVAVVGTALAVLVWELRLFGLEGAELNAYDDGLTKFTNNDFFPWGKSERSTDIVIVAVDDKTLEGVVKNESYFRNYGAWPYFRKVYADVFTHLIDGGAKVVIWDATQDEPHPDPSGDHMMAEAIAKRGIPYYLGFNLLPGAPALPKVSATNRPMATPRASEPAPAPEAPGGETFPSSEEAPAGKPKKGEKGKKAEKAKKAKPTPKVEEEETFPGSDEAFPSEGDAALDQPSPEALAALAAKTLAFPVEVSGELALTPIEPEKLMDATGALTGKTLAKYPKPPITPLLEVVSGVGMVSAEVDGDGKMRRTRFAYTDGVNTYVTLPVAVAADLLGAEKVSIAPGRLTLGKHEVPINRDGTAEINYGGPLEARFRAYSLINVLDDLARKQALEMYEAARAKGEPAPGEKPPARDPEMMAAFQGKIVVLAGFALGTADQKPTPFSPLTPGVVKQVSELDNLLHARFITHAPYWVSILLAFATALFSVSLITVVRSTLLEIGWPVLLLFGFFLVTGSFLVITKVHVLSAMPMLAGELASVSAVAFNHLFARKDRDYLRQLFQNYMESDLVELMVEGRELPRLDGEDVQVTAFFSDIKGFSTFSEQFKDDPRALMRLLNRYFSQVIPVLKRHGGCIDKYIGDAVVCLFGAPVKKENHSLLACRAALDVKAELAKFRAALRAEGLPDIFTRVGINTDRMVVGNIGSDELLDYTALGDGMNLASRLEGINKYYDTGILLGPHTHEAVKDEFDCRLVDWVRVAGKTETIVVHELLGPKGQLSDERRRLVELYESAHALYRQGQFSQALPLLAEAYALDPDDGPVRVLGNRCKQYAAAPPPNFDGVTSLEK